MDSQNTGLSIFLILLEVAASIFYLYCAWRIFEKARKPGWAAMIPIYNYLVWLEIIGRPWWWLFLLVIPIVNMVVGIIMVFEMATVFGKSTAFGVGLLFLTSIFIPILALGDAAYRGPLANS